MRDIQETYERRDTPGVGKNIMLMMVFVCDILGDSGQRSVNTTYIYVVMELFIISTAGALVVVVV